MTARPMLDHVCRMGLEGIVSKRTDAPYRSGPSKLWLKSKNPAGEALRREDVPTSPLQPNGQRRCSRQAPRFHKTDNPFVPVSH